MFYIIIVTNLGTVQTLYATDYPTGREMYETAQSIDDVTFVQFGGVLSGLVIERSMREAMETGMAQDYPVTKPGEGGSAGDEIIAPGIGVLYVDENLAPSEREPIPENVFYSSQVETFYDIDGNYMGREFWLKWHERSMDFPLAPIRTDM